VHWQYLVLASMLSIFGALIWAYISISYDIELGIIASIFGLVQGFLAFIYMREKGDPRLIFYSFIFSLLSLYLGKYLLYVHYYDWVLSGVVDKSELSFSLLLFYLKAISYDSISDFIIFYKETFEAYDIIWIGIIIASSLEYTFFYSAIDDDGKGGASKKGSRRRIRRRFDGQQF
jgi:heme/copper-type cytochrome/quinol oxidase subunit 4